MTEIKRKPIKLIKKNEIARRFTMPEAIEAMGEAFSYLSSGTGYVPDRYIVNEPAGFLSMFMKPAFVKNHKTASIKFLTQKNGTPVKGIPTILGIVLLIDVQSGEILSLMDGEYLTALRTGAASGLATRYLARKDASKLALFGCGAQGRTQLAGVDAVRRLEKIWVFDKSPQQAERFIADMQKTTPASIEYSSDLSVLKDVDIICTATNAQQPLFFMDHIKAGTHINAVGAYRPDMQELDPEIIRAGRSWFDTQSACMSESGDYLRAFAGFDATEAQIAGEIGDCVLRRIEARKSDKEITIFKSVGTAIQDFVVAERIYEKSLIDSFGTGINLYE